MLKIKQKNWLAKKNSKQTQKEVKNFGTVIYKEFDKVCKERLGKSFSEVISLVPETGLTRKESPVNAKKKAVKQR